MLDDDVRRLMGAGESVYRHTSPEAGFSETALPHRRLVAALSIVSRQQLYWEGCVCTASYARRIGQDPAAVLRRAFSPEPDRDFLGYCEQMMARDRSAVLASLNVVDFVVQGFGDFLPLLGGVECAELYPPGSEEYWKCVARSSARLDV